MTDVASDPLTRIAEIRQENRGGDVSYRDIDWLCDEVLRLQSLLRRAEEERDALCGLVENVREAVNDLYNAGSDPAVLRVIRLALSTPGETKESGELAH